MEDSILIDKKLRRESVFLTNLAYFFRKTDGSDGLPNSLEGDLLKRAKLEIEELLDREVRPE
jgi:hypothetical protein